MIRFAFALVALATMIWPACEAVALDVPVEVQWEGMRPDDVTIDSPRGSLRPVPGEDVFRGTLRVSDPGEQHVITVKYGDYRHRFDVRALNFPNIVIKIDHHRQISCDKYSVKDAYRDSEMLEVATSRAVDAGELLNISGNNACLKELPLLALRARVLQMRRMYQFSGGQHLVNSQILAQLDREEKYARTQYRNKQIGASDRLKPWR